MILHQDLTLEELVPMSLQELVYLSRQLGIDLEGIIESKDWEKIHHEPVQENQDHDKDEDSPDHAEEDDDDDHEDEDDDHEDDDDDHDEDDGDDD